MSDSYSYVEGALPLLISVPHDGREIPAAIGARMTTAGRDIPDTDWDVARLYAFATDMGAHTLTARYSRYVVDLNRSADDEHLYPGQIATGLCPENTFAGDAIYRDFGVSADERAQRVREYWLPYHEKIALALAKIRGRFGYALLWDAHSIASVVPRLFDGNLPTLNLGSNSGASCDPGVESAVAAAMQKHCGFSVLNGRFKGGYITRNYGDPDNGVQALQLEIAQRAYWDEEVREFDTAKAEKLRDTLRIMLETFLEAAKP